MQGVNVTADLEAGFGLADASMGKDGRPDFHNVPTHPRSCRRGGVGAPPEGGAPEGGERRRCRMLMRGSVRKASRASTRVRETGQRL